MKGCDHLIQGTKAAGCLSRRSISALWQDKGRIGPRTSRCTLSETAEPAKPTLGPREMEVNFMLYKVND